MTPDRWVEVKRVLQSALDRPASERVDFLAEACAADGALRAEVETLLEAHVEAGEFLERSPSAPASLIGTTVGSYRILEKLGAGGMGEVYLALDTRLSRRVALKFLSSQFTSDPERVRRFRQEAHAASALNHPNILTIYELGEHQGVQFIASELVEGETLRDRLERGPMETDEILRVVSQIASALRTAHAAGVVHRDIKPENVMLRPDGYVKVLDFGLAKLSESSAPLAEETTVLHTATGVVMGTTKYMSPEQVRGQLVDSGTDQWSLGVVLYEMLSGHRPFEGPTNSDVIASILGKEYPPLQGPEELRRITARLLRKEREQRYPTASDLCSDLASFQKQDPQPVATSNDRRSTAPAPRWRWTAAALVLVAAAVLGAFVTVRMMRRGDATPTSPIMVRRLTEFLGFEASPALSPDGRSFAFTGGVGGTRQLWVRLLAGGQALQLTDDDTDHLYPRWTRDSSSIVYFSPSPATEGAGSLWQISALGGTPRRLASSLSGADIGPGGQLAFFRLSSGKIELVVAKGDASEPSVLTPLETGYKYETPRWSPDGKFIAYQRGYHGLDAIYVVALDEKKPRQLTFGRTLNGIAWQPDSSGVVFSSVTASIMVYQETYNVWSLDLDETEPRQLTFGEASYVEPDVNRSGEIVATRISLHSDLWRFPVDGDGAANVRGATPVTRQTAEVRVPAVSPSGGEIAYLSDIGGHSNLWILRIDTGEARQLTFESDPKTLIGLPLWSPDGRRIAFYWRRGNDLGYSMIQSDGSGLRQILTKGWWTCWSPDGRWLYYQDLQAAGRHLMKMPADGGPPIVVRNESAGAPALSSDGKTLYFVLEVPRQTGAVDYEIRSASPENGPSRALARIGAHRAPDSGRFHPVISPDDRWLALPLFDGTTANIWAVSTSDGSMRRITDFGERSTFITRRVSWSPDGRSIYAAVSEGDADIVRLEGLQP